MTDILNNQSGPRYELKLNFPRPLDISKKECHLALTARIDGLQTCPLGLVAFAVRERKGAPRQG